MSLTLLCSFARRCCRRRPGAAWLRRRNSRIRTLHEHPTAGVQRHGWHQGETSPAGTRASSGDFPPRGSLLMVQQVWRRLARHQPELHRVETRPARSPGGQHVHGFVRTERAGSAVTRASDSTCSTAGVAAGPLSKMTAPARSQRPSRGGTPWCPISMSHPSAMMVT